jgi:hypothetical protein
MLLRGRPMEMSTVRDPDKSLTTGKGCQRSALGPNDPNAVFTLPQRGSVITAPRDTSIALRVKAFAAAFPVVPLATIAQGRTVSLRWSPVPTGVRWTFEVTPVPPSAGAVVTACPDDTDHSSSNG